MVSKVLQKDSNEEEELYFAGQLRRQRMCDTRFKDMQNREKRPNDMLVRETFEGLLALVSDLSC